MAYFKASADRYRAKNKLKLNQTQRENYKLQKVKAYENRLDSDLTTPTTCSRCNETKLLSEFTKSTSYVSGYASWCRVCNSIRNGSGEALIRRMYANAKDRAKNKDVPFTITTKHLLDIGMPDTCPVLGIRLDWVYDGSKKYTFEDKDNRPSLDRIVPAKGYVPGNIMFISWKANRLKNNASISDIEAILSYMRQYACTENEI